MPGKKTLRRAIAENKPQTAQKQIADKEIIYNFARILLPVYAKENAGMITYRTMMIKYISYLFLVSVLLSAGIAPAQSKRILQQEKQRVEQEINFASSLLDKVRKNKKATYNEYVLVKKQIQSREQLIRNINRQIQNINREIVKNEKLISELKNDLKNLKEEYAKIIYNAYKTRNNYQKIMFLFASKDINQAYRRLKYLEQYTDYRKKQSEQIVATQKELEETLKSLKKQKEEKTDLLASENIEKQKLLDEKKKKKEVVKQLSKKEKELRKKIEENEKIRKRLSKKIQKIIAEEIAKAAKKTGKSSHNSTTFALTPEEQTLSDNFAANKGKLPWPVQRGIISENFGKHPHPFLKHVQVNNRGINILTKENTKARAVFSGTVTLVMKMQGYHTVIMIRHGNFITVYSNIINPLVKKGDKVKTKQEIGTVFTSPKDHKTELHFELWKNKKLFDPKPWLAKGK